MLPRGAGPTDVARVYDVDDAALFYGAIAVHYDQGNSVNLLATHMEVIAQISRTHETKSGLRVLDLAVAPGMLSPLTSLTTVPSGGRTSTSARRWRPSSNSTSRAGRSMRTWRSTSRTLARSTGAFAASITTSSCWNLVLSSMPQLPDFAPIAGLMRPDGLLVVSDINPQYTEAHPYYKGTTAEGAKVALRTRAVQPLDVLTRAEDAGLRLSEMKKIGDAAVSYSFIAVFANTVQPGGNRQGQVTRPSPRLNDGTELGTEGHDAAAGESSAAGTNNIRASGTSGSLPSRPYSPPRASAMRLLAESAWPSMQWA